MLGWVFAMTGVGAVLGGLIGAMLGKVAPGMFYSLFREVSDVAQVAMGLGITNGLIMGFVLGVVVVVCDSLGKDRKPQ